MVPMAVFVPGQLRADVAASPSGGGPAEVHGGVLLSKPALSRMIIPDACYGPPQQAPIAPAVDGHTPPEIIKWKACFPVQGGLPVDPQVAAGPTRLVVTNQSRIGFYDKAGTYQGSLGAATFFGPLGLSEGPDGFRLYRDVRTLYDEYRQRFWIVAIVESRSIDPAKRRTAVVAAVSQTDQPLGGWWLYWWDAVSGFGDPASPIYKAGDVADDPFIGIDAFGLHQTNRVSDGVDDRYWRVSFFRGSSLASGVPAAGWQYWDLANPNGRPAWMVQPAVHHGPAPLAFYASRQGGDVVVWGLTDPLGPSQSIARAAVQAEDVWRAPQDAPQHGSAQKLGMSRLGAGVRKAVYRAGLLHLVTNDGYDWSGNGLLTSVRLLRANVSGFPALANDPATGFIDTRIGRRSPLDPSWYADSHYGWPAVEVNSAGDMAVVLSRSGPSIFPEMHWSLTPAWSVADLPSRRVRGGQAAYAIPNNVAAVLPWGEASGASVDPVDDLAVWIAHEVAGPANVAPLGNYEIWVAKVLGSPRGNLVPSYAAPTNHQQVDPLFPIDVDWIITNDGDGAIPAFTVAFTLVREDGLEVPLGILRHPGLRSGEVDARRDRFVIPAGTPAGLYAIRIEADPRNEIPEYSERDNVAMGPFVIEVR
jgi:CARDB